MNKKTFIKKLKNNLSVLDESEVNDIIEEYSDNIDEKIKNGKSEEEAIKDFGDINELSKEILKAYKINPKFVETEESSDLYQGFENVVKKGAKKISDFTKKFVDDVKKHDNITLELICEIIIKAIIVLVICAILAIPFWALLKLGHVIFDLALFPLDVVLHVVWGLLVWILYFAICILVGFAMFKNNIKKTEKDDVKKEKKTKKSEKNEDSKEEIKNDVVVEKSKLLDVIKVIGKVSIFIFLLLPLIFIIIGLIFSVAAIIYHIILGINLWGILIILIGALIFFGNLYHILSNVFKAKGKVRVYPFLISVFLVAIGGFMAFDMLKNVEVITYDDISIKEFEYTVNRNTELDLDSIYEIIYDENLSDNQIIVEVYYYERYIAIDNREYRNTIELDHYYKYKNSFKFYDEIVDNLKENKIIDYSKVDNVTYKIYGNNKTINSITID